MAISAVAAVAGLGAGLLAARSCGSKGPAGFAERVDKALKKVDALSAEEAKSYIAEKKPLIIDVRDSKDLADGIKGAVNIPLSNLIFAADQDFALPEDVVVNGKVAVAKGTKFTHDALKGSKDRPILVSCGLGGQALVAGEILKDYGFTQVKCVNGGNAAWKNRGGEVCDCMK